MQRRVPACSTGFNRLDTSIELPRAQMDGTGDYELTDETQVPYLFANGVRLARVVHTDAHTPSTRVFLELGDHLGSTSVVLDHAKGDLVQRSTAYAYGEVESSHRPTKWEEFREDDRFTGKEDDVEVWLIYFGKRFYNPLLGRWISADPLAIHAPVSKDEFGAISLGSAALNPYAYVHGKALIAVDPHGLDAYLIAYHDNGDDASSRFEAAAFTRAREIMASSDFDPKNDFVYMIRYQNMGQLKDAIESRVEHAKKSGYGATAGFSIYSHAGPLDGPSGDRFRSNQQDEHGRQFALPTQLTRAEWKQIDFNWRTDKPTVAGFYGCRTSGFADRFLKMQPDVDYSAGQTTYTIPSESQYQYIRLWDIEFRKGMRLWFFRKRQGCIV